jgi:eukaryotic-like serine/threonine-protein kinase
MSAGKLARMEEIFEQVVDLPPSEQQTLLNDLCGNDAELKEEIAALLEADACGHHPALRHELPGMARHLLETDSPGAIPSRFGRYLIRGYLGQGGMGRVYLAEREDLGDKVAVKFLQDAWTSPVDRRRFAQEQRLLAGLNHPNIARLYDAGVEHGTPWFAMEYVEGVPIDRYCRTGNIPLEDRLKLFRTACEAVAYAHRNLTVHLDLKPSNILVTQDGTVKLLDFGIARNLEQESGEGDRTKTSLRLFSLNYAAPEQIRGEVLDVQTDVHGLGVVLYELLTGITPADLSNAGVAELMKFSEEEVERPSVADRKSGQAVIRASKAAWSDLDVLCLTTLRRERGRRYPTVEALIRDLDHFLKHEPLEARGDSLD